MFEDINRLIRRTDNTMAKSLNSQTIIYKTLYQKIEQHEPHKKLGVNPVAPEG